jgi:hypothetical protein
MVGKSEDCLSMVLRGGACILQTNTATAQRCAVPIFLQLQIQYPAAKDYI